MIVAGITSSLLQWFGIGIVEVPLGMILVVTALTLLAFIKPGPRFSRSRIFKGMETVSTTIYIIHPLVKNTIIAHQDSVNVFKQMRADEYLFPLWVLGFSLIIGVFVTTISVLLPRFVKNGNFASR